MGIWDLKWTSIINLGIGLWEKIKTSYRNRKNIRHLSYLGSDISKVIADIKNSVKQSYIWATMSEPDWEIPSSDLYDIVSPCEKNIGNPYFNPVPIMTTIINIHRDVTFERNNYLAILLIHLISRYNVDISQLELTSGSYRTLLE